MRSLHYNTEITQWLAQLASAAIIFGPARSVWGEDKLPAAVPSPTADMTSATFKMLASLALIIGIIIVVFYLLKRLKGLTAKVSEGPAIRIVASLPIAPKRSVTVVEVGAKWLVLGVGTESISLLSTMEPSPGDLGKARSEREAGGAFERILRKNRIFSNKELRAGGIDEGYPEEGNMHLYHGSGCHWATCQLFLWTKWPSIANHHHRRAAGGQAPAVFHGYSNPFSVDCLVPGASNCRDDDFFHSHCGGFFID